MEDAERIFARVIEVDPNLPGTERAPRPIPTATMLDPFRTAILAGMDLDTKGQGDGIKATIRAIDAIPGRAGQQTRQQALQLPYAGYMVTRDTTFIGVIRRWGGRDPVPSVLALAAIEAGDTVSARRIAQQFPRADTTGLVSNPQNETMVMIEAEVLTRIGDLAGALATLERMNPRDFSPVNLDPRWAFYPRALLERAALHEQLGEPERADSLYSQAIELWKDADAKGRPLLDAARQRLATLRDRPKTVPLGRKR
jgi:tetratricopeptide (TPR) repeat protein